MSRSYVCLPLPETIGTCELCGATDHHLIEGECPFCRPKVTVTLCSPPPRRQGQRLALNRMVAAAALALKSLARTEEVPLGAEADVSHVRRPRGAR